MFLGLEYNGTMEFTRLLEFCSTADAHAPADDIRVQLPNAIKQVPNIFEPYEIALQKLDTASWEIVKQKLIGRVTKHPLRGWSQFFETMAEVRGFNYLVESGYTNVKFIPEDNHARTPDIEAKNPRGTICLLESKNVGFSDDERKYILENTRRLKTEDEELVTREVTQGMPEGLKNKITSAVKSAREQLLTYLPGDTSVERIIYLTLHMDIPMLVNMENKVEVINFLKRLIREEKDVKIEIDELSAI